MTRNRRILVVDDEPAVRSAIVRHLLRRGFDVHDADSAEAALLQSFREPDPFDLVLTDVHLPNLSGTPLAWKPQGSLAAEARRPAATGDYEAWKPE